MTDATFDYLPTLEAVLPGTLTPFTRTLLQLMWVRPDGRFLVATATRLRQLLAEHGDRFPPSVKAMLPLNTLDEWLTSFEALQKTPLKKDQITTLARLGANPLAEARLMGQSHINRNYLSTFPLFTALLTTRQEKDPYKSVHDNLTAWYAGHAMAHLKDLEWAVYQTYVANTSRTLTTLPHGSSQLKASLAVRTLQKEDVPPWVLQKLGELQKAQEIEPLRKEVSVSPEHTILTQHLGYLEAFLLERYRNQAEDDKKKHPPISDGKSPPRKVPPKKVKTPDTFLDFPELTFTAAVDPSTSDLVIPTPSEDDIALAAGLDLALIEVVGAPLFMTGALGHIDQAPDEKGLSLFSHKQLQFRRRLNQFHRWRSDYLPVDTRRTVIQHLKAVAIAADGIDASAHQAIYAAAAAALILVSVATGRSPDSLVTQFDVLADSTLPPADTATVSYDLARGALALRPHRAPTQGQATDASRPVSDWLVLPDLLDLHDVMRVYTRIRPGLDRLTLKAAISRLQIHELERLGATTSQLTELLPRQLMELTGHFSTTVLLTDWDRSSARVDLHYLTPAARAIYLRYVAAMRALLPIDRTPDREAQIAALVPDGYVGMVNTPDWNFLEDTIVALAASIQDHRHTPEARHNAFVLYVIMMTTFALGLRHTVDIQLGRRRVGERVIAYFREKDGDRLLVIPAQLERQLETYDRHRAVVLSWPGIAAQVDALGQPQFFLFDATGKPALFHPNRFGEYLAGFGIAFPLPLNSLRRAVFSELVELGIRGIVTDHYIGHAAEGREPLVAGSAFRLQAIEDLADEIDLLLKAHDWRSVEGPFHG